MPITLILPPSPGFLDLPTSWDVCMYYWDSQTNSMRPTVEPNLNNLLDIEFENHLSNWRQFDRFKIFWTVTETEAQKVFFRKKPWNRNLQTEVNLFSVRFRHFQTLSGHVIVRTALKKLVNIMKTIHLNTGNGNVWLFLARGNKLNWMYFRWVLPICNQCPLCEATLPPL